jgi:large subunit ribosomal protein L19
MNPLIREVEAPYLRSNLPYFRPGDTVRISVKIIEGDKERVQDYEGVVIARRGSGLRESFTVRRVSFGIGMERTFQLHSPRIESLVIVRHGLVRRAKLYYLRNLSGKKARLTERRVSDSKLAAEANVGGKALRSNLAAGTKS